METDDTKFTGSITMTLAPNYTFPFEQVVNFLCTLRPQIPLWMSVRAIDASNNPSRFSHGGYVMMKIEQNSFSIPNLPTDIYITDIYKTYKPVKPNKTLVSTIIDKIKTLSKPATDKIVKIWEKWKIIVIVIASILILAVLGGFMMYRCLWLKIKQRRLIQMNQRNHTTIQ